MDAADIALDKFADGQPLSERELWDASEFSFADDPPHWARSNAERAANYAFYRFNQPAPPRLVKRGAIQPSAVGGGHEGGGHDNQQKLGPNDPCPCGSGATYGKCNC